MYKYDCMMRWEGTYSSAGSRAASLHPRLMALSTAGVEDLGCWKGSTDWRTVLRKWRKTADKR